MVAGKSDADSKFMHRCIDLASRGEGKVSPNPLVGAVLVKKGRIISSGFHERFGGPHAEVNALRKAGKRAFGSTLYVSLEPCSHTGKGKKTPPCVPLIILSGVSRVVIAAIDRNPRVCGKGIFELKAAGIKVKSGVLASEAEKQNEAFFKSIRTGKPFVCIKMAQTKNGIIGICGKSNVRISGAQFDRYAQVLRNKYDGILVGIGTILADNPRLTCRIAGGRNPARIIVDSALQIPLSANALERAKTEKVIIATSARRDRAKEALLEKKGATVLVCGKDRVDLKKLFSRLPGFGIHSVLIEGGAKIASDAMDVGLADKAVVCISQKEIPRQGAVISPFTKNAFSKLKRKSIMGMGSDSLIEGYF